MEKLAFMLICCMGLSACATIFTGKNQEILLTSAEPDTKIYLNGNYLGDNLVNASAPKKDTARVYAIKQGCSDKSEVIEKNINPIIFLNNICAPCYALDFASGAAWKFAKSEIDTTPYCKK